MLGGSSPRMARINVVLPEPFGPSTPMNSPGLIVKLASAKTMRPPIRMLARSSATTFMILSLSFRGASEASEPGIEGCRLRALLLWIPGPALRAVPE